MATAAYTAGYRSFDDKDFSGGLNLRDKADAVGDKEAIDLLNVTFAERGAMRQRDGYVDLNAVDLTNRVDSMTAHYTTAGLRQLILGAGTRIDVLDNTGGVVGSQAGLTRGPWTFAQFGDPTRELVYCANGVDPLVRWDGAAFALGAALATVNGVAGQALPKAGAVCITASTPGSTSGTNASNRLVATAYGTQTNAGPGGTQSTPSRVHFSNAGQPETWETDGDPGDTATSRPPRGRNFIDVTPGDGEFVIAAVTWRELVFVFKQTKFFVLWGEGTAGDGTPTFQVREVVNAVGLASAQAVSVGRDGVYFANRRGVYRTSGGDPVLLSDIVSPMWTQDPEVYFRSSPINLARLDLTRMLWHMERIYYAVPTGTANANDRVLVYDTQRQYWSLYDLPAAALASFRASPIPEVHFGYSAGPQRVGHLVLGATSDRGATISSRWRSGWTDYGSSQVKTLRETKLWGKGAVIVGFSTDFYRNERATLDTHFGPIGSDWTYAELTARGGTYAALGVDFVAYADLTNNRPLASAPDDAMVRYATRGVVFSTQFTNSPSEPAWSVHRMARHLREIREASVSA